MLAGSFMMGTADTSGLARPRWAVRELNSEQPQHQVNLSSGYWIDRFEVTHAAFQAFVEAGGYGNQDLAAKSKIEKGGWWDSVPYVARAAYRHFTPISPCANHYLRFDNTMPHTV